MAAQNISNGLIGNGVSQIGQRADDAIVALTRVFTRHADDQSLQFFVDPGPSRILAVLGPRSASGTRPESYRAWQCRRLLSEPSFPYAFRFRPESRVPDQTAADGRAAWYGGSGSPPLDTHSAKAVPGSQSPSRRPAAAPICGFSLPVSSRGPFEFVGHTGSSSGCATSIATPAAIRS